MKNDSPDPRWDKFVTAQNAVYGDVVRELKAGKKQSHWMWFIFPQLRGLGRSAMSQNFGIASLAEARSYLQHPVLGPRLYECTRLMLAVPGSDITSVLGYPDDLKFRSCMTLFAVAAPDQPLFEAALNQFFGGLQDETTLKLLAGERGTSAPR